MKILYITHTSKGGGATIALGHLVNGMLELGHDVYILTNGKKGQLYDLFNGKNVHFYNTNYSLTMYPLDKNPLKYIYGYFLHVFWWHKTKKYIGRIIDENNIDIVHTNVGPLNLALSECKKRNIPHVWHHREYFDLFSSSSFFPNNNYFYKIIQEEGNYNICITRQILDYCKLNENEFSKVIFDGVFYKSKITFPQKIKKDKYFLFVGRIEPNKGLDELLIAYSNFYLYNKDYTLKVVGPFDNNDTYYKKCLKIIEENKLTNAVTFLGSRNDVFSLMSHATALIVSSHFEGFGFVTVEGMINNTLVIGKNTSGTKEQFDVGLHETGKEIALRYETTSQLIYALQKSISTDFSEMRKRAYDIAVSKYSVERCIEETVSFYSFCLHSQKNK